MQVLEQLENDHPLPKLVLEHRSRCKLLDGFLTDICSRVRRPSIGPQGQYFEAYFQSIRTDADEIKFLNQLIRTDADEIKFSNQSIRTDADEIKFLNTVTQPVNHHWIELEDAGLAWDHAPFVHRTPPPPTPPHTPSWV